MPAESQNPFPILEGSYDTVPEATGRERWVEDTYGSFAWVRADQAVSQGAGAEFVGLATTGRRIVIFFSCLAIAVLALFGRVSFLAAQGDAFSALSENNRLRRITIPAPRGVMYDRNGVQLVENVPDLKLAIVPADLPMEADKRSEAIKGIAFLIGADGTTFENDLSLYGLRSFEPVVVASPISRDQAVSLAVAGADHPAIRILNGTHRRYTLSNVLPSLSHLLGYLGKVGRAELDNKDAGYTSTDAVGKTGLETVYEEVLRGTPGLRKVEVDALGNEVRVVGEQALVPGANIQLAIDTGLTGAAERSLGAVLKQNKLTSGVVIVEDVRTGELLTLVSLPSYSNNRFSEGIGKDEYAALASDPARPLFPRAIAGGYPSGSTVKLVVAAAALADELITSKTSVVSTGGIWYGGQWFFPDWKAGGHGVTDVRRAIAWSVNTFFYMIGGGYESFNGLGVDRLAHYFTLFGIGSKLGVDLPSEATGLVPTPAWKEKTKDEAWFIGDTYHIAIGQGDLLVTPLQVAAWTVAVANGGTLWQPRVVSGFLNVDGEMVQKLEPVAVRTNVAPRSALATVRAGMRDAVIYGSAIGLAGVPVEVAGKTGTAQWNSTKANHAWFTGFAPYENPEIAITVLVEEGSEGSSAAVPVARDVLNWWAAHRSGSND